MDKLILLVSCGVAVVADTFFVFYAKTAKITPTYLGAALVLMNIAALVWTYSMRKGIESSMAITFYALFTVAACSSVGVFVFKDRLSTLNVIGLFLALIALVLISI